MEGGKPGCRIHVIFHPDDFAEVLSSFRQFISKRVLPGSPTGTMAWTSKSRPDLP